MMKNRKKTSLLTILLCALAGCLILVGGIGATRAALTTSETFKGTLETPEIAIQLIENGKPVEEGALKGLKEAVLEIGAPAEEVLTVKNVGTADQYARVTLYRYWTDSKGKRVDLDPAYIKLTFGEGWAIDKKASKWDDEKDAPGGERVVLYYTKALKAGKTSAEGEESTPLITAVTADSEIKLWVAKKDTTEDGVTTTTYIYKYDGLTLNLEASADAIQTQHAQEAVEASWGTTNVTIDESAGTLSVAN